MISVQVEGITKTIICDGITMAEKLKEIVGIFME